MVCIIGDRAHHPGLHPRDEIARLLWQAEDGLQMTLTLGRTVTLVTYRKRSFDEYRSLGTPDSRQPNWPEPAFGRLLGCKV